MWLGICIGMLIALVIWRVTSNQHIVTTPDVKQQRAARYTVHLVSEDERLRQTLQAGQDLAAFAQVELQNGVVVITAERITTMRLWNNKLIMQQSGVRGGMGHEQQIPLYGIQKGLCLLGKVQEV